MGLPCTDLPASVLAQGQSSLLSKVPFLSEQSGVLPRDAAIVGLFGLFFVGLFYTWHSIWVSAEMYSAPSIVMQTRGNDGSIHIFDDFREGYAWLRYNTPDDAIVGSWCAPGLPMSAVNIQSTSETRVMSYGADASYQGPFNADMLQCLFRSSQCLLHIRRRCVCLCVIELVAEQGKALVLSSLRSLKSPCRWDYGYQTTAMANRTVLVDNNTWNNTHIATVGRAMASPEKQAWEIFRSLDCTHVLVIFGGFIGCGSC